MTFYERFISKCTKLGIAPSTVAEELGLGKSTVSTWKKRGSQPTDANIAKIANYFGCTVAELTGNEPGENKKPAENGGPEDVPGEFMRLQEANELFLQLDEAGRAQALAYLKFLASQREN